MQADSLPAELPEKPYNINSESEIAQSCPTLCNPVDCSPPGSTVHWILQARILEWVAISFSRVSSWPRDQTHISCVSCIAVWFWLETLQVTLEWMIITKGHFSFMILKLFSLKGISKRVCCTVTIMYAKSYLGLEVCSAWCYFSYALNGVRT